MDLYDSSILHILQEMYPGEWRITKSLVSFEVNFIYFNDTRDKYARVTLRQIGLLHDRTLLMDRLKRIVEDIKYQIERELPYGELTMQRIMNSL